MKTYKIIMLSGALAVLAGIIVATRFTDKISNRVPVAQTIYGILDQVRIPYDIDKHGVDPAADTNAVVATGVDQCIKNIDYFVHNQKPIQMLLVGFPFKSSNQEKKVLGHLPDMAERKALEYLQAVLDRIEAVYKPGAQVLIFTDGIPFAEFFGIPFEDVVAYEKGLKALVADLPDIHIFSSEDVMKAHGFTSAQQINMMIDQYAPSDEEFKTEHPTLPTTALKRFALELDHEKGRQILEKHSLEDIATRLLAREMRMRNYIAKTFTAPEYFRLTVHLSADVSKKFGIRLSPNSDITPYHGVLVEENDGSWSIRLKKDVDVTNYSLHQKDINGITCAYYKRNA